MKTNTPEQELFTLSYRAARQSNRALEDVAMAVSERPEFPGRLDEMLQQAFSRACFQLMVRQGQGSYDGYKNNPSMQRVGGFYARDFCTDPAMRVELEKMMPVDLEGIEAQPVTVAESLVEYQPEPVEALMAARKQVMAAYDHLQ